MWGGTHSLDVDEDTVSMYATDGTQTHSPGLAFAPSLPALARAKTGGGTVVGSTSRALPSTGNATTVTGGLYGLPTQGPMEVVQALPEAQDYGRVPGGAGLAVTRERDRRPTGPTVTRVRDRRPTPSRRGEQQSPVLWNVRTLPRSSTRTEDPV